MIYIAITIFLFLLRYVLKNDNVARNQVYYIIFLALFLFSTFRYQVGCDWSGYYYMYLKVIEYDLNKVIASKDPISHLVFYFVNKMGLPYPYVNIPFGIIFFIGIYMFSRRQPDPLSFIVFLFPILIINMPMSGIRQAAAIGIICLSFVAFIDRKPITFILYIIFAAGFHSSALIFLFLLPFATGRFNNSRLIISLLLAIPGLGLFVLLESAQQAARVYIGTGREAYGAVFRVGFLFLSGIYFLLFLKQKWKRNFNKDYSLASLGALGMIVTIFLIPISTIISDRFSYYFIPIQAMIFARLPYLPFRNFHSLHIVLPYIGILAIFLIWTMISFHFQKCYNPYDSWIFGYFGEKILK